MKHEIRCKINKFHCGTFRKCHNMGATAEIRNINLGNDLDTDLGMHMDLYG